MDMLQMKLPGTVSDESLPRIGELRIKCIPGTGVCRVIIIKTASNIAGAARIVGDAYFTTNDGSANYGKSIDYPTNTIEFSIYAKGNSTPFFIFFGNKYYIQAFTISTDTPSDWNTSYEGCDFYACDNLKTLRMYRSTQPSLDFESLKTLNLETLITSSTSGALYGDVSLIARSTNKTIEVYSGNELKIFGDIESFKDSSLITSLVIFNSNCTGNIEQLGKLTSATRILLLNSNNIEGEVATLLDNLYSNGKQTGSITIRISGTSATYNGLPSSTDIVATFTSGGWSVA